MGIDTALRRLLQKRYPTAFHADSMLVTAPGSALLVDLPPVLFKMKRPAGSWIRGATNTDLTGTEVLEHITGMAGAAFDTYASCVVLCCDWPAAVPKQKAAEQARRTSQQKLTHRPYPDDCSLSASGVWLPGSLRPERIDMHRLMANRQLRTKLMALMRQLLTDRVYVPPDGCVLILDHFPEGAYCFGATGWWLDRAQETNYGEADLKIPMWLRRFASMNTPAPGSQVDHRGASSSSADQPAGHACADADPVREESLSEEKGAEPPVYVIQSIDSDQMVIMLHFLHNTRGLFHGRVWIQYWGSMWLDANELLRCLDQDEHFLPVPDLVALCVLCGTDFVDKSEFLHGVGAEKMADLAVSFRQSRGAFHQMGQDITLFRSLVLFLRNSTKPAVPKRRRLVQGSATGPEPDKSGWPADVNLAECHLMVEFNMQYWTANWRRMRVHQPMLQPVKTT